MEENKEILELLKQIEKNGRQQVRATRFLWVLALAAALACIAVFILVFNYLPRVDAVVTQMQSVLTNLETATEELASLDISSMMEGVDELVSSGQEGLAQTMEKLNTIDIDTLNKAIQNLSAVVEHFAKLIDRLT